MSGGDDTIVAVATAAGRGAVGILRLSGGDAFAIAERLAGTLPAPRQAGSSAPRSSSNDVATRRLTHSCVRGV